MTEKIGSAVKAGSTEMLQNQEKYSDSYDGSLGVSNLLEKVSPVSPKEARKILGIQYRDFNDEQLIEMVTLLNVVAREFVQESVPEYIR